MDQVNDGHDAEREQYLREMFEDLISGAKLCSDLDVWQVIYQGLLAITDMEIIILREKMEMKRVVARPVQHHVGLN